MSDKSLEDSSVQAGEQADEEAGEEKCGESNGGWSCEICYTSKCCAVVTVSCRGKSNPLPNQSEAARKEDEDESWRKKASKVCLLFWKDPARSHLQVLGEAQGGGEKQYATRYSC